MAITPRMRARTAQQLDLMVGSAGKVLGQAADLGLGGARMLGGLLTRSQPIAPGIGQPKTIEEVQSVLAGGASRAASFRDSILRRGTISSAAPSTASQAKAPAKETELSDVSSAPASEPKAGETNASPSISSRLASLPGLGRLNATPAVPGEKVQPATVTGGAQPARVGCQVLPSCQALIGCDPGEPVLRFLSSPDTDRSDDTGCYKRREGGS